MRRFGQRRGYLVPLVTLALTLGTRAGATEPPREGGGISRVEGQSRRLPREARAGIVMTGIGLGGLGLVVAGFVVDRDRQRKQERLQGQEGRFNVTSLGDQKERASAMVAAGAVLAGIGVSLGTGLLVASLRRSTPVKGRRTSVQVKARMGGLMLIGRF